MLFNLFARRKGGIDTSEAYLYLGGTESYTLSARMAEESSEHPGWWHLKSLTHPLKDADKIRIVIFNASTTEPLAVDDLIGLEQDTPIEAPGHLLRVEHVGLTYCQSGATSTTIWVPLPLDHGVQVPLHVELKVTSTGTVKPTKYELDAEGNLGARITIEPSSPSSPPPPCRPTTR